MRKLAAVLGRTALAGCVVACLTLSGAAPATAATAATTAAVRPSVPAAFPSTGGWLNAIALVSASDAWAVGIGSFSGGLIFHWNGKRWSYSHVAGYLNGVTARTATDAWAVGASNQSDDEQPVALHWNGKSWTAAATPALGSGYFNAAAATATANAWAVGEVGPAPGGTAAGQPLIEHWNGRRWTVQCLPALRSGGELKAVTALSATNAWAVGVAGSDTLIEHWNGVKWSRWTSPNLPGGTGSLFFGLTMISPTDGWAVGSASMADESSRTLTAFWNGRTWRYVASPSRAANAALFGVTAVSARDVWAVGTAYTAPGCIGDGCGPYLTLVMHWNGTRWTTMPSPNPESETIYIALNGIVAAGRDDLWTAGNANYATTLLLHWNGKSWTA